MILDQGVYMLAKRPQTQLPGQRSGSQHQGEETLSLIYVINTLTYDKLIKRY